jgi:Xaa-Pro aminopeptidase
MTDDAPTNNVGGTLLALVAEVSALRAVSTANHGQLCERLTAVERGQEMVRSHVEQASSRLSALEAVCLTRPTTCGAVQQAQDARATRNSEELAAVRELAIKTRSIAEANRDGLREQGSDLKEVSQVTMVSELERAAAKAAWRRVGLTVWRYGWKVFVALATLGLLGAGAVETVRLLK